tara:strand:- start:313785 stop:313907 length:123 start_codon:yes stop_codon:yes gene_type:complete
MLDPGKSIFYLKIVLPHKNLPNKRFAQQKGASLKSGATNP